MLAFLSELACTGTTLTVSSTKAIGTHPIATTTLKMEGASGTVAFFHSLLGPLITGT